MSSGRQGGKLHRVGSATRLAAMRASPLVIQRKGRWSSNAFMVYMRVNMEDLRWLSEVLGERGGRGIQDREVGRDRRRWGGRVYSFVACLSRMTINHASLARRGGSFFGEWMFSEWYRVVGHG